MFMLLFLIKIIGKKSQNLILLKQNKLTFLILYILKLNKYRIDKYYYLMRRIHFYTFKFLERVNWRKQYVLEYVDIYDTGPLWY